MFKKWKRREGRFCVRYLDLYNIYLLLRYERCALMSSEQKITVYSSNYATLNLDYISFTHNTPSRDADKYKKEMLPSLLIVKGHKLTGQ